MVKIEKRGSKILRFFSGGREGGRNRRRGSDGGRKREQEGASDKER